MAVLCKNCSGKLIFNPASQLLECKACGGSFRPEDIRDINTEAHSKYYDTRVYVCGHCGAEVITNDTEASTLSAEDINYSRKLDQVLDTEKQDLMFEYGNDPYEGKKHSIPEQLLKNGEEL